MLLKDGHLQFLAGNWSENIEVGFEASSRYHMLVMQYTSLTGMKSTQDLVNMQCPVDQFLQSYIFWNSGKKKKKY